MHDLVKTPRSVILISLKGVIACLLVFCFQPLLAQDAAFPLSGSSQQSDVSGSVSSGTTASEAQSNISESVPSAASSPKQATIAPIDCTKQEDKSNNKRCKQVSGRTGFIAALAAITVLLLVVGPPISFKFMSYLRGMDGRYSKSKFQMALWFFVLIWSYLTYTFTRVWILGLDYVGGIEITDNLLLLSGLSALTYGGAKAITTGKTQDAQAKNAITEATAPTQPALPVKDIGAAPNFPMDLVTDDNQNPDFGDLQMIIVVLLAVCVYVTHVVAGLGYIPIAPTMTLPDVDSTLLGVFGIGQGAYLIKKFAGSPGTS